MFSFRSISRFFRDLNKPLATFSRQMSRVSGFLFFSLWGWAGNRNWWYLLQGLPALIMAILVLSIVTLRFSMSAQGIEGRYLDTAKNAYRAGDLDTTLVAYERLAEMGQDRPENLYEMARALEKKNPERAYKIMNQIAPVDKPGHAPAHVWQAGYLWRNINDPYTRQQIDMHLKRALENTSSNDDAVYIMLGQLNLMDNNLPEAERNFAIVVGKKKQFLLQYARVLASQKKTGKATEQAEAAVKFFSDRANLDIDDKLSRLGWAESLIFLEKFEDAIKVLNNGLSQKKDRDYQLAISGVYNQWLNFIANKTPDDYTTQLALLSTGLKLDPTNVALLNKVVQYMSMTDPKQKDLKDGAQKIFQKVLADGHLAMPQAAFFLGMDYWIKGDNEKALHYWEQAVKFDATLPTVANNVAFLLAHRENPDFEKALKMINLVIDRYPNDVNFLDTRGKIYLKMNRCKDAISDLLTVIYRIPEFPGAHGALATAYDCIGDADQASAFRRRQEELDRRRKGGKTP
jgi:tetratricopeptide (TPR) repeat protein